MESNGTISGIFEWGAYPGKSTGGLWEWGAFLVLVLIASFLWSTVVKQVASEA